MDAPPLPRLQHHLVEPEGGDPERVPKADEALAGVEIETGPGDVRPGGHQLRVRPVTRSYASRYLAEV